MDKRSVRKFRDCLVGFADFLDSIGDIDRPAVFERMAADLENATRMSDVREVQRQARQYMKGTVGTLSDGPPIREGSPRFRYPARDDLYGEFHGHLTEYRTFAHKISWRW